MLFNPLCSFRVLEVKETEGRNECLIKLKYENLAGIIERVKSGGEKELKERERTLYNLGKLWREQEDKTKGMG